MDMHRAAAGRDVCNIHTNGGTTAGILNFGVLFFGRVKINIQNSTICVLRVLPIYFRIYVWFFYLYYEPHSLLVFPVTFLLS
jgi:hypothetical protein